MRRETEHMAHTHLRNASMRPPRARMRYRYDRAPRYVVSWREVLLAIAVLAPIVFLLCIGVILK